MLFMSPYGRCKLIKAFFCSCCHCSLSRLYMYMQRWHYTNCYISFEVSVPFEKCSQNNNYITLLCLTALDGVHTQSLEEEDYHLVHGFDDSDSENDFIYHERVPQALFDEVWDLPGEDVDTDFPQDQGQLPSVDVYDTSRINGSLKHLLRWLLIFLCLWSSFSSLSDNALEILLTFLRAMFDSMGTIFPVVASFAVLFPKSVHLLRKQLGLDKDRFIKYVVCPKCHTLYNFDDCYELVCGRKVTKKCTFVQFPNHRQHFRRTKCDEPLLKEVSLKSGGTKLYPHKVYCYNSIIDNLRQFLQRPGFVNKCELWRSRDVPDGFLTDIFDGHIWKEWQYVGEKQYLAASLFAGALILPLPGASEERPWIGRVCSRIWNITITLLKGGAP